MESSEIRGFITPVPGENTKSVALSYCLLGKAPQQQKKRQKTTAFLGWYLTLKGTPPPEKLLFSLALELSELRRFPARSLTAYKGLQRSTAAKVHDDPRGHRASRRRPQAGDMNMPIGCLKRGCTRWSNCSFNKKEAMCVLGKSTSVVVVRASGQKRTLRRSFIHGPFTCFMDLLLALSGRDSAEIGNSPVLDRG